MSPYSSDYIIISMRCWALVELLLIDLSQALVVEPSSYFYNLLEAWLLIVFIKDIPAIHPVFHYISQHSATV